MFDRLRSLQASGMLIRMTRFFGDTKDRTWPLPIHHLNTGDLPVCAAWRNIWEQYHRVVSQTVLLQKQMSDDATPSHSFETTFRLQTQHHQHPASHFRIHTNRIFNGKRCRYHQSTAKEASILGIPAVWIFPSSCSSRVVISPVFDPPLAPHSTLALHHTWTWIPSLATVHISNLDRSKLQTWCILWRTNLQKPGQVWSLPRSFSRKLRWPIWAYFSTEQISLQISTTLLVRHVWGKASGVM
jgi:hypothetical protein